MSSTSPEIGALMMLVASLEQRLTASDARAAALEERVRRLELGHSMAPPAPEPHAAPATIAEHRKQERQAITEALAATGWNRLEAAAKLGLPRRTLYRRMQEYGIQMGDSRSGITKGEKARRKAKG